MLKVELYYNPLKHKNGIKAFSVGICLVKCLTRDILETMRG